MAFCSVSFCALFFFCGQVYVAFIVGEQRKARTVLESLFIINSVRISPASSSTRCDLVSGGFQAYAPVTLALSHHPSSFCGQCLSGSHSRYPVCDNSGLGFHRPKLDTYLLLLFNQSS